MSRGDTANDHSYTNVDNSKHSWNQVNRHDVHSTTVRNDSSRTTIINNGPADGNRFASLWQWVLALVFAVLAIVARSLWFSSPAPPPPPVIVNVTQNASAPGPAPSAPQSTAKANPVPAVANGNGGEPPSNPPDLGPSAPTGGPSTTAIAPPPAAPARLDPATFVNRGAVRAGAVSVLMVDSRRGIDATLTQQVGALVDGTDGLFKPAFVQDGLFSRVHQGEIDLLRELGITTEIDRILLGTRMVTFSPTEVAGQPLVRASVTFNVRVVRPSDGFKSSPVTATDIGAGFDQDGALRLATENALKKLATSLGR